MTATSTVGAGLQRLATVVKMADVRIKKSDGKGTIETSEQSVGQYRLHALIAVFIILDRF
jgi:hypothetical protein